MKNKYMLLTAVVLLLGGLACIAAGWHGEAGVNMGYPFEQNTVRFCGSTAGGPAFSGIICILAGLIVLVVGLFRMLLADRAGKAQG
ncbi:MAG TPA: hypothetical protein VGF06_01110 [Terriglobales bacterium]|jgi:hypothetical protein